MIKREGEGKGLEKEVRKKNRKRGYRNYTGRARRSFPSSSEPGLFLRHY